MAELPLAMWIMIVGLCFPLLVIATSSMRFGFFWNACREAAQQAARCQTFQNNSSVGTSAINTADQVAALSANSFSGISIVPPVNVYILQTNVISGQSTKNPSRTKLAAAADTDNNVYEIQVELNGMIQPLISNPVTGMLGSIPGLTGPFPVTVRAQYSCEVPQGLNQ